MLVPVGIQEILLLLTLVLVLLLIPVYLSYKLAIKKNMSPLKWIVLTVIFNWPIVIALFFFPQPKDSKYQK